MLPFAQIEANKSADSINSFSYCDIQIPPKIIIGKNKFSNILLKADSEWSKIWLTTNVGTIDNLKQHDLYTYTARYQPPLRKHPQVAIISVLGRSKNGKLIHGWKIVSLWGQGEAVLRTQPGARIERIRIGETNFGPVVADNQGIAIMPVEVPPGANRAFYQNQVIGLNLPAVSHIHMAVDGQVIKKNAQRLVQVFVYVATKEGVARRDVSLELRSSRGSLRLLPSVGPGVQWAQWELLPGATTTGELVLTARLRDEPFSQTRVRLYLTK
jgi:hypothetical protein